MNVGLEKVGLENDKISDSSHNSVNNKIAFIIRI